MTAALTKDSAQHGSSTTLHCQYLKKGQASSLSTNYLLYPDLTWLLERQGEVTFDLGIGKKIKEYHLGLLHVFVTKHNIFRCNEKKPG